MNNLRYIGNGDIKVREYVKEKNNRQWRELLPSLISVHKVRNIIRLRNRSIMCSLITDIQLKRNKKDE